jgi:hypothetical protein
MLRGTVAGRIRPELPCRGVRAGYHRDDEYCGGENRASHGRWKETALIRGRVPRPAAICAHGNTANPS